MKEKTPEQKQIDNECGCDCHKELEMTQNFMWCGNCAEKHKKDIRYPKQINL